MDYQQKLIEGKFPCQQVGAETKRERGASSALPPLYFLHVWWARRPLTPSRAAVLGSILSADTDPEVFLKDLGIVKKQAVIGDKRWTLVGKNLEFVRREGDREYIPVTDKFCRAFEKENERRETVRQLLNELIQSDTSLMSNELVNEWLLDNASLSLGLLSNSIEVVTVVANPALTNERIDFAASTQVKDIIGQEIKIDPEDLYAYGRAYSNPVNENFNNKTEKK